jgi:hypothetical protein
VILDVLRGANNLESGMMSAMVARWERLSENHRHLMFLMMVLVVRDFVNTRLLALIEGHAPSLARSVSQVYYCLNICSIIKGLGKVRGMFESCRAHHSNQ